MRRNSLFNHTRWRLTAWYVGVMGVILSLGALTFYQMLRQAHWHAIHQQLESLTGTLHDGLEPILKQPNRLEPAVEQLLPGLCPVEKDCLQHHHSSQRHILGMAQQEGYYIRFTDQAGRLLATVGKQPTGLPTPNVIELWQTLQDSQGKRYHQISLLLKTANKEAWGYLQIGRSLQEFDMFLANTRLALLLGLPAIMLLISGASWWLAGLAMRPVYQSYQKIQQFTADAAHELRTPLAATRATVESVLEIEDISGSEARKTLQAIERQNNRLAQLVQDLLLLSRMDVKNQPFQRHRCCLNTLIQDVADEFECLAIAADLALAIEMPICEALWVLGDEEQLYRVVANLVSNAIQYTPPNGIVTIRLDREERHMLIQVLDTGIGIVAQDQEKIFDRFYRVNSDRARITGGSGLGLAIAMAIAQAHQGSIQVQSTTGKGSTFTVKLPLMPTKPSKQIDTSRLGSQPLP
jgi:signal transduction histidine kinase